MPDIPEITTALLAWFSKNGRDLPWRHTTDPYAILVSEIMLQQTQVKTVVNYWLRWMKRFPTAATLAAAPVDDVLKHWEGLGYYTRARNLHKSAKLITGELRGRFPRNYEEALRLPGIGRYTAGAICSIAYNQPTPVLDGNVIRVLTRLFAIAEDPRGKAANERLWMLARDLVMAAGQSRERQACSNLNQSLMELGALVCTPRQPACAVCPLAAHCRALREGCVASLPNLAARAKPVQRRFFAFVVQSRNQFLARRRPAAGVNGNLWEFPNIEVSLTAPDPAGVLQNLLAIRAARVHPFLTVRHSITNNRIKLDAFLVTGNVPRRAFTAASGEWFTLAALDKLAFPGAHRKIVAELLARIFHTEHETNTLRSRRGNEADARTPPGIRLLTSAATKAVK